MNDSSPAPAALADTDPARDDRRPPDPVPDRRRRRARRARAPGRRPGARSANAPSIRPRRPSCWARPRPRRRCSPATPRSRAGCPCNCAATAPCAPCSPNAPRPAPCAASPSWPRKAARSRATCAELGPGRGPGDHHREPAGRRPHRRDPTSATRAWWRWTSDSLSGAFEDYFRQSEQLPTRLLLAADDARPPA